MYFLLHMFTTPGQAGELCFIHQYEGLSFQGTNTVWSSTACQGSNIVIRDGRSTKRLPSFIDSA